jgi:enoyl reductase-like protein
VTGLLRLLFGPSIRIAALVIARPLQLVEEALADVDTEFDVDEPVPFLPVVDEDCTGWTLHDHTWLYELGAHL